MTGAAAARMPGTAGLLEAAAQLTRRFGADAEYARAGGGNSSVKDGDTLYIKPSGLSLASITASTLMPLAMRPLLDLAEHGSEEVVEPGSDPVMRVAMAARLRDEGDRRPSVECVFHALIPRQFVVHTHPTIVNALTCATHGERIAAELFGETVVWVPYVNPGLPLAREIDRRRRTAPAAARRGATEVTFLQNHGLIVAGDDPSAIFERSEAVVATIRARLAEAAPPRPFPDPAPVPQPDPSLIARLSRVLGGRLGPGSRAVVFDGSAEAAWVALTAEGHALADAGALTPDQIVYAGSRPLRLDIDPTADEARLDATVSEGVAHYVATNRVQPVIVVAAGVGVFASGPTVSAADTARELFSDGIKVGRGAMALGGVRALAPAERSFIETWEAEAYRVRIGPG